VAKIPRRREDSKGGTSTCNVFQGDFQEKKGKEEGIKRMIEIGTIRREALLTAWCENSPFAAGRVIEQRLQSLGRKRGEP